MRHCSLNHGRFTTLGFCLFLLEGNTLTCFNIPADSAAGKRKDEHSVVRQQMSALDTSVLSDASSNFSTKSVILTEFK